MRRWGQGTTSPLSAGARWADHAEELQGFQVAEITRQLSLALGWEAGKEGLCVVCRVMGDSGR
jgi:hypothetical protein